MLLLGLISLMASCFLGGHLFARLEDCDSLSNKQAELALTLCLTFLASLWLISLSVTG